MRMLIVALMLTAAGCAPSATRCSDVELKPIGFTGAIGPLERGSGNPFGSRVTHDPCVGPFRRS